MQRHGVPCRQREVALPISTFDDTTLPGIGKEFTQRLQLRHGHHVTLEAFEVGPLEMSSDARLPNWWMRRHPPINIWSANTATITFTDPECQLQCTSHALGDFPIEYEPSLVDRTTETTSIGCLRYLGVSTAGTADIDWNVLSVGTQLIVGAVAISAESTAVLEEWIPEEYRDYLSVFEPQMADALPPHRSFDHAIDLQEGAKLSRPRGARGGESGGSR